MATYKGSSCKRGHDGVRYVNSRECVTCSKMRAADWNRKNKERHSGFVMAWRSRNIERTRRVRQAYREANRFRFQQYDNKRRAQKLGAGHEPYDFRAICEFYGSRCLSCGCTDVPLQIDHVIPLSLGGVDAGQNIQPLCAKCNQGKYTKMADYREGNIITLYANT